MVISRGSQPPINRALPRRLEILKELLVNGTLLSPLSAAWTAAVTGSGATTQAPGYKEIGTGITTGSTARLYTNVVVLPGTTFPVDFSKRLLWGFTVRRYADNANVIARVQLKAATTEGALGAAGLGIRMANLTMTGESYGTSGAFTATIQAMTNLVIYHILVDHEPAVPRIRFYVNGTLQVTVTTSANIPQSSTDNGSMILSILNGAGTTDALQEIGVPWLYVAL